MLKKQQLSYLFYTLVLISIACTSQGGKDLEAYIREKSHPLTTAMDLDALIEKAGQRRVVLLGEASHGTHEYYIWRDSISRRLIAEKDFRFIAVEGDFASLYELNRYVKNMDGAAASAREVLENLDRWPRWMWGNEEIVGLAEWLRAYNDQRPQEQKVGFYGMDVYDEWRSKDVLLAYLERHQPELFSQVKDYYSCFATYHGDSWAYAQSVQRGLPACDQQAQRVVALLEESGDAFAEVPDYEYFYVLQNAHVKANAEKFYRKSITRRDASSWNARVTHMHETVNRLLDLYGDNARGIVWAHNTHVGDARYTDMQGNNSKNIGQLSREHYGPENVFSVGFTTYKGRVLAGSSWESRMQNMRIASAQKNSVEHLMQKTGNKSFYLIFDEEDRRNEEFIQPMGHRAIGVVFNPANEPRQYVPTIVPLRYDAFIFFYETRILNAL